MKSVHMLIQLDPALERFRLAYGAAEMSVQSFVAVQLLDGVGLVIADVAAIHGELLLNRSMHRQRHEVVLHGHQLLDGHLLLLLWLVLLRRKRRQQLGGWHLRLDSRLHKLLDRLLHHVDGWRRHSGRC